MMRTDREYLSGPWCWFVAIVGLSALVGVWNAQAPPVKTLAQTSAAGFSQKFVERSAESGSLEKIESTLAQAGCPGWMVVASEGESAFQPPDAPSDAALVPDHIQQTALRVAQVPRVKYQARVQVASRALFEPPARDRAKLAVGAKDDPDDLLDGVPDLLADSEEAAEDQPEESQEQEESEEQAEEETPEDATTEEASTAEEEPAPEVESEQPAPVEEAAPVDPEPAVELEPAAEPEPVVEAEPAIEAQAPEAAQPEEPPVTDEGPALGGATEEPLFPGPALEQTQPRETQPTEKLPPEQKPPAPKRPAQQEEIQTSREQAAPPVVRPKAPPKTQEPAPVATPKSPQPKRPVTPMVPDIPSLAPVQPSTPPVQQSPFSPPPAPVMPTPHTVESSVSNTGSSTGDKDQQTYCEFLAETQYPSAEACSKCHEKIYDEWRVSSHAYAAISPMFHKFEQKINDLSQGTIGYFCYRCHSPVGTTLGVSRAAPLWELPKVVREGVTCVACHRVNQRYGKVNGERRIEPGDIHAPVYGSIGGSGIAEVVAQKSKYKVKTSPHEKGPGQNIHAVGVAFDQLGKSEFCVSCHQVAVQPGVKLEVVWEQYRASPACKKGVSCQDCHMGRVPGVASGYEYGAAAKVGEKVVHSKRKHANHVFYGPGYSIAHPGIFPHNPDADRWSMRDWLLFDYRAGWGTEEFEEMLEDGKIHANFPPAWAEVDDRYDARDIVEDNLKMLEYKKNMRQQLMENGSHVDGPFFDTQLMRGQDLKFHYVMTNTNEGHNLPSGSLGAQPQLWANVVLIGPRGQRLWESGYTDRWGDVADIHSVDVQNKRIPYDWQLFNLQTMFLITGAKGTDREFFLPVNVDFDQLPFLRPGAQPISVINHPPFIRMESRSLAPLGSREIPYKVPAHLIREPGHYRLSFRLRSRAEPIYFMRFCGSTREMERMMNEWMVDFHQSSVEFLVR